MNDIVTKENWTSDPDNAPLPSDFIRIESNIRKVEENRQEETAARTAAVDAEEARAVADVDAEEARATAAESTLQSNINNEASARASADTAVLSSVSSFGGIGSYVFGALGNYGGANISPGGTITLSGSVQIIILMWRFSPAGMTALPGYITSGTWRCIGIGSETYATLWTRVS